MLKRETSVLVVVDIQGKLAQLMHEKDSLFAEAARMIRGAAALGVPVIWMEQNPKGLGATVPEVAGTMPQGASPIPKMSFSCCGEPAFIEALEATGRKQVLVCGIETHICVYQTSRDLATRGYEVQVVADAVSSRKPLNREVGLKRAQAAGAALTTVEMALFEMLGGAGGSVFKEIVAIVK
jgi:nicotinamidase-related amidase